MVYRQSVVQGLAFACIMSLFSLNATSVSADTLVMHDGSRLNGEVIRQEDGSLEFSTSYAGVIKIQWSEVSEVMSEKPMQLYLSSEELIQTQVIQRTDTSLTVETASGSRQLVSTELISINPDNWQRGQGYKLSGRVNLALEFSEGNTDKDELDLDGELTARRQRDRLRVSGQFEKDKAAGVTTAESWILNSKYDYFVSDKWYYGGTLGFKNDEFADLDLRTTVGPHVGYQFYESKAINLSVDAGLLYVSEDFMIASDNEYAALGWTVDYDQLLFDTGIQLYHRQTGRFQIDEVDNVLLDTWTGLRFPLYAGVQASAEVQADYDGGAPSNVDEVDTTYRLKLGYQW